jgi:hypothetical protein
MIGALRRRQQHVDFTDAPPQFSEFDIFESLRENLCVWEVVLKSCCGDRTHIDCRNRFNASKSSARTAATSAAKDI